MKLITPIIYVGTLFGSQVFAQPAEGDSPEKAAVTALAREYESAFAKGDAATLAGFFAEDAEQTIVKVDDKKFTWEANNRTLEGEPQPSIGRLEIKRVEGK